MTLRSASLLAMLGTIFLVIILLVDFVRDIVGVSRDILPMMVLLRSILYLFIGLSVAVFFVVFHRKQT